MVASVGQLSLILALFFPPELAVQQAVYVLGVLISLYPLYQLHGNQMKEARRQNPRTAWKRTMKTLLTRSFSEEADNVEAWTTGINLAEEFAEYICADIDRLYTTMGLHNASPADLASFLFRRPRPILTTRRLDCEFCPVGDRNLVPSLRRRQKKGNQKVWLLDDNFKWVSADLVIAYCSKCKAEYYPDIITRRGAEGQHQDQILEYDAQYLRVSKSGIWMHRKIALAQEKALQRFHSGWSNFADWLNDTTDDVNVKVTARQSQRLFLEHFSRRLLVAHGKEDDFTCEAHPPAKLLARAVREVIGEDGGTLPGAMSHGCIDCTHVKRYREDLVQEGAILAADATDVVESEAGPGEPIDPAAVVRDMPPNMPEILPQHAEPPDGSPRGYARMVVMDGKTIRHKKCALDNCHGPLVNYKDGRFCETHLDYRNICGIIPCGRPVHSTGALTCDNDAHISWRKQYEDRFHRLNFPGVQRVIRRQNESEAAGEVPSGPSLQVRLQALGETPGEQVVHTFKAKTIYCLQTVQWACGVPVGWGKCYRGEGPSQVLAIMNKIWDDQPQYRPSFIAYDKACDLLRHIVTQNSNDLWLETTKFVVDAWHYIGHRASDLLCRTRCNPAPTDGTQPDLVLTSTDDNSVVHQTRAFNTETAEQLNSWLNGFESQLQQMTDVNYDFFVHVLMMIYGETVEKKVVSKGRELSEEFWDQVNGINEYDRSSWS
ncbi:hypothetical protein DFH06DRAFT_1152278 [Mycena polygramma]|nr:hypothetical protein DFH06DRAFT_1152278 [Mycena polygramma]